MTSFYGKYRGEVTNNVDPQMLGRVQVSVPAVLGEGRSSWAMPCSPYAGSGVGFFALPPVGANVWVEFEAGDVDYPIWTGCFWGQGELPVLASPVELPFVRALKTDAMSVQLDERPGLGGLLIEVNPPYSPTPLKIALTQTGIEITNGAGKIAMELIKVTINDGALEVT